jgi:LysM repeat protein
MENINKKDFSRIYELMSFDRGKTLYEMEQKWDNILNEDAAPGGLTGTWDAATNTYTIAKGDYLSKIAKAFGVDWKKMYEDNKSTLKSGDPNLVYPNEKVIITGSSVSSSTSSGSTSGSTSGGTSGSTSGGTSGTTSGSTSGNTIPGDLNGDGVVDGKDLPPDQTMDNSGTTTGGEDLDYDADAEGFEEQEPEMDREIDTTRTLEINKSNNPWADFFGNKL